ncbi:MAG: hypothetical protein ABI439_03695 [Rhodospirillales bacterium]
MTLVLPWLLVWLVPSLASAQTGGLFGPFGQATVSFSADFMVDADGRPSDGRIMFIPQRRRVEVTTDGRHIVGITYLDLGVGYSMDLDRKVYSEFNVGPTPALPTGSIFPNWTVTRDGEDTVDGYVRTRYNAEEHRPNGDGFRGILWLVEAYNLVVEAKGINKAGGRTWPVKYRIFNIKVGPQDPALFEPPPDFTRQGTGVDPSAPPRVQP